MNTGTKNNSESKGNGFPAWVLWLLFIACAAMAFFFTGCKEKSEKPETEAPEISVANPVEMAVTVTDGYPATLESSDKADVVARVNGMILTKHFKDGDYVVKGQKLFTIESTVYAATLHEANAQLASAQAELQYANHHYNALTKAYQENAVSEMEVLQAKSQKDAAASSVMSAQSQVQTAATKFGYCNVTAPISGNITSATLDVGNYVNGEGSPVTLATIYDNKNLLIHFSMPESEYATIADSEGNLSGEVYRDVAVLLTDDVNADPHTVPAYKADITYEAPAVDPSTGNLHIRGKIKDSDKQLRAGMYGVVKLPVARYAKGILVRDASISTDQRGKYLYTVNDKDEIVYTPIKVGQLYSDTLRLVKSGLKPGQRYVVDAMMTVRAGEKIRPKTVK